MTNKVNNQQAQQQRTNGGGYFPRQEVRPEYPQQQMLGGISGKIQSSPKSSQTQKKIRPMSFYVSIVIAVIAVVAVAVFAALTFMPEEDQKRDPNGIIGQLDGKSPEEIQAELDKIVEEGMFQISIASVVEFPSGTEEGEVKIENVPGNRYLMQVVITRDDTGEVVYTSGILDPNYHIQFAKLDVDLDPGTYLCTATFHALDPETEEEVGAAAAQMTIIVKS